MKETPGFDGFALAPRSGFLPGVRDTVPSMPSKVPQPVGKKPPTSHLSLIFNKHL